MNASPQDDGGTQDPGRGTRPKGPRPVADAAKLGTPRAPTRALGPSLTRIPMSSGVWAVSADESPRAPLPRGLYQQERPEPGSAAPPEWAMRARLPYVHARITRRDGAGRQKGVDYLISAGPDTPRVVVTHYQIKGGEWAGAVGLPLSDDSKIIAAAGTAIRHMPPAGGEFSDLEAVPSCDPVTGRVRIPAPETLPPGYLATGAMDPVAALAEWTARAVPVAAANPRFALALGASAISPFAGWLDYLTVAAFILELVGEPNHGKTTTLRAAGAIWGAVPASNTGVVCPWNVSPQVPGRRLGQIGILPAIFDEQASAGNTPDKWRGIILGFTDGARQAADRDGGVHVTMPYCGVILSGGNASITAGLGSGRSAGIGPKRIMTLSGPFTSSVEEAESVRALFRSAHGHPGRAILESFTGPDVARLVEQARDLTGTPPGKVARSAGMNMHLVVAGAAMLDAVLGTGTVIRDSAVKGAAAYLGGCAEPEHDADRLLSLLRESMASQPGRWPTVSEYREIKVPRAEFTPGARPGPEFAELPQHGIDRNIAGVRADDDSWFAVFGQFLDELAEGAELDRAMTLAECDRRGWIHRTATDRARGLIAMFIKHVGRATRFNLAPEEEDAPEVPVAPAPAPVPVPVPVPAKPLCSVCGTPMTLADSDTHPGCAPESSPWPEGSAGAAANPARTAERTATATVPPPVTVAPAPAAEAGTPAAWVTAALARPDNARHFRAPGQREALTRIVTLLDENPDVVDKDAVRSLADRLRLLAEMEGAGKEFGGPFLPRKRGAAARLQPWKRDGLPVCAEMAIVIEGHEFRRDYHGPVISLDRNGAWIGAIGTQPVAFGPLKRTGECEPPASGTAPGYYLVNVYPWTEAGIPSPLMHAEPGGQVWIPAPTMGLLAELTRAGRWPDGTALDSWTGEPVQMEAWGRLIREVRRYALQTHGYGSGAYQAAKDAVSKSVSMMNGTLSDDSTRPVRVWAKCKTQRIDWRHQVITNSAVFMWRAADRCRALAGDDPALTPVGIRAKDELLIPAAALDLVTTRPYPGGTRPPVQLDPSGVKLGTFKVKTGEDW